MILYSKNWRSPGFNTDVGLIDNPSTYRTIQWELWGEETFILKIRPHIRCNERLRLCATCIAAIRRHQHIIERHAAADVLLVSISTTEQDVCSLWGLRSEVDSTVLIVVVIFRMPWPVLNMTDVADIAAQIIESLKRCQAAGTIHEWCSGWNS